MGGDVSPPAIYIAKSGARNAPTLPVDAVTRTFGIFGMKDSGKTTTARVLVEGICKTGGHVIVFDPVGVWWGATRAGSGPGIPGVVIGGEHGDVPLEETGGKLIAELALARQYKLIVVDLQLLRKGAARRFLADCLEELYHRNRLPLSVVFEEADQTLPQNPRGMDPTLGRVLGAAEDIVKLGRTRGLGSVLISQRFATVNKNVTEQIESLILLRLIGPKDRKAAKEWIESNGDPAVTAKILDSMASLHQGEGWLYSPGWLRLLEKVRIRASRTLDSSATPTVEQMQAQDSATRAPVSLDTLRDQMAQTIERAKENDPKLLRKRIAELERRVSELSNTETPEPVRIEVPVPVLPPGNRIETVLLPVLEALPRTLESLRSEVGELLETVRPAVSAPVARDGAQASVRPGRPPRQVSATPRSEPSDSSRDLSADGELTGPQQRVLDACAWLEAVGFASPSKGQVGFIAGYRVGKKVGGTFGNLLGQLRGMGMLDYPSAGAVRLTEAGASCAAMPDIERTSEGLQSAILARLSEPERRVMRSLIRVYPESMSKQDVGAEAGYAVGEKVGGTFGNLLGKLRGLGLIDYPQAGAAVATDVLFV